MVWDSIVSSSANPLPDHPADSACNDNIFMFPSHDTTIIQDAYKVQ